jgi:hypothetical protein
MLLGKKLESRITIITVTDEAQPSSLPYYDSHFHHYKGSQHENCLPVLQIFLHYLP